MITLAGIELPDDLDWEDEFGWEPVGQVITPTLSGAIVVEEAVQSEGRPITLRSDGEAWVRRSIVLELQALAAVPSLRMQLHLNGRIFTVIWRRESGGGFEAKQLYRIADPDTQTPYEITLRLLEVNP
ncbi:hypothetical protein AHGSH82_024980 [Aeromonas hydrophila]|uniref:hypothetical protein n=1 Tax=Aeromonas hydrophila TaxID=644 RepID=UPI00101B11DA|nr:hypothetical protein [Aeromonas hydrophila]BBG85353.1 hypothetical protein AHGSH82_024980 [Aeromonas hydrophila]BBT62657.1 hypothetical protein WP8S18E02_24540 [Aeromonas hydrophila]